METRNWKQTEAHLIQHDNLTIITHAQILETVRCCMAAQQMHNNVGLRENLRPSHATDAKLCVLTVQMWKC